MIQIVKKEDCCGCTACANACPRDAICMEPDEEGFLYPRIDLEQCVSCGICDTVCPVLHKPQAEKTLPGSYVLRTKEENVLMQSTSGGFVTPLLTWVLEQNGIVCAASYDSDFRVVHTILDGADETQKQLARIRGSKYVQSDLQDCFRRIKQYLKQGRLVCFVGTTCQVNGLKAFIGKDEPRLICVDLVCHGTPSPMLWSKYLDYQKHKYGANICEISFRNKTYGYHSGTMKICFDNGKTYYGSARVDYMLKSFFREISSRPVCYQCPFKDLNRCSDYTIYDCWHASALVPGLKDDDKGYTNVIVQTEKGEKILEQIKQHYEIRRIPSALCVQMGLWSLNLRCRMKDARSITGTWGADRCRNISGSLFR